MAGRDWIIRAAIGIYALLRALCDLGRNIWQKRL